MINREKSFELFIDGQEKVFDPVSFLKANSSEFNNLRNQNKIYFG